MPEICEVEVIRRELSDAVRGRRVIRVRSPHPLRRSLGICRNSTRVDRSPDLMLGKRLNGVSRWAKYLFFDADDGTILLSHLGMTGIWLVDAEASAHARSFVKDSHLRHAIEFEGGLTLSYYDARGFGALNRVTPTEKADLTRFPDVLDTRFSVDGPHIRDRLSRSGAAVKVVLDQDIFPGVGAYLAAEFLHRLALHPLAPARMLLSADGRSTVVLRELLAAMLARKGASFTNYTHTSGGGGTAHELFRVYGREGLPCGTCGAASVAKIEGIRASHHCPACQPPSVFADADLSAAAPSRQKHTQGV